MYKNIIVLTMITTMQMHPNGAKHPTQPLQINNQVAQIVAATVVAAENTALGPLANLPTVKTLEKYESKMIESELNKSEKTVEKELLGLAAAAQYELASKAINIENAFVKDMCKLCASWSIWPYSGGCTGDDATKD